MSIIKTQKGLHRGGYAIAVDYDYTPKVRSTETTIGGKRLIARILRDREHINTVIAQIDSMKPHFAKIASVHDPKLTTPEPFWSNTWLPSVDSTVLYTLIVTRNPKIYLEVGSGNSTMFVRRAIRDHGLQTRIISIDPRPRADIDAICDEVIRMPVEDTDIEAIAARLSPGDVVFVDNSHRGFQNSDVTVCFMELMPALKPGTIFGIHDISLPYDYHKVYIDYFYNEQYYLGMYLLGGAASDTVIFPAFYCCNEPDLNSRLIKALDVDAIPPATRGGGSFWLELGQKD